ncbi:effector binding domain-containing protein [Paenilisteria rocourtiae]|uniref:Putative transcriptional regulator YdeE n=1 Tax=Listeria rocourtiae TaxID=647910 RepID=A0A4R6ZME4_9LIST|nr:effector binding domain-containing protein [Listeria rocourtiae]EUJ44937.1 hypothetical protein PROCOU_12623 [Listeria rocourtiae FSL F6-920]TDR53548.1 putative transcriptional regulator YdeE [Listeria rocourtiae]
MQTIYVIKKTRTNNFNDPDVANKIRKLWTEVQNLQQTNATFYGIYEEYENDYRGDYTVSVATSIRPFETSKEIMIPDQGYQVFNVETDVFATWQQIWNTPLNRSYLFDYEMYLPNGTIQIYIGLNA